MVLEPEQEQSQRPQPGTVKEQGEGVEVTLNQNTAAMEICDSPSECEEEARSSPVEAEERSFVANLYCFMKDRGTPIERIPHLGFKQINLWRIYSAVEKLGGYDSVTAKRLWKNVYDELGGSPGSTSAATCTRRHYERLVLPFERQLRGEEDKPLPPSKPRKQYKRSPDGKGSKSEGKRKRNQLDKETDSEAQERLETGSHSEIGTLVPSTPWTVSSKRLHLDCPQPSHESTTGDDHSSSAYTLSHLVQDTTPCPWRDPIQSVAGEVISPLEKKKRVAQASLSLSLSPRQDDCKDRPSVIHCSPSPGLLPPSRTRNPSDGSPLPVSSSSSRSPSPYSVSSEDCPAITEDKPSAPNPELPLDYSSSLNSSVCNVARKPQSCSPDVKGLAGVPGQHRDFPQVSPLPVVSIKGQTKDFVWNPVCNMSNRRTTHQPPPSSCTYTVKPCWVPSTSSFTKVHPKSVEPLRPIPHQPGYKLHQHPSRSMLLDNTLTYAKKLHMVPRLYPTEKKEKPRTILSNSLPTQQPLFHSNSSFPVSYFVPAYDRTRGDAGQQPPLHPIILPTHMIRLPQSQTNPMYRHVATGPTHSAPYEPALCSYPYPVPLWSPHTGYSITGVHSHYPHTRM